MRIISGSARGRRLISPEGYDVRPTTDKVKESMFNILRFELEGANVLDLFSGSGQLGIEALSGGAAHAVFTDASRKSLDVVRKNIELSGFSSQAKTILTDAIAYLQTTNEKFDVVLLDPPYHKGLCDKAFKYLPGVLNDTAVVLCETQADEVLPAFFGDFTVDREYKYSAIKLIVYRKAEEGGTV